MSSLYPSESVQICLLFPSLTWLSQPLVWHTVALLFSDGVSLQHPQTYFSKQNCFCFFVKLHLAFDVHSLVLMSAVIIQFSYSSASHFYSCLKTKMMLTKINMFSQVFLSTKHKNKHIISNTQNPQRTISS